MKIVAFKKLKFPDSPGVYFFLKGKEVLYIGKATSLRDRVKSYFGKDLIETRGPIILDMVFKADKIKWKITDSVLEALILEAELIKKHQPKYNTKEKSDKSFNYVCITKEKLPKVIVVRGNNIKHLVFNKIFGPFPSNSQLLGGMKIVRRIFPFLDDKSKNYMEFYRQINLAPDLNDRKLYLQNIKNIKLFFSGEKRQILRNLKKQMIGYSREHEFEKAGETKRQIFALQHINDVALIKGQSLGIPERTVLDKVFRIEAYDIAHMGGKNMVGVMTVVENGEVVKSEYKKFSARGGSAFGGKTVLGDSKANDIAALKEVLERRLAHKEWAYPGLIVVDGGKAQINIAKAVLVKMGLNIEIVSVVKDERHKAKAIMGDKEFALKYKKEILLANSEAHRFAISYHKNMRNKSFLS
ncbi:hypothetical protein A3A05_02275 [Candidatus Nomurabacteria bacterium RIFCSPLOWO2_01_FULL_41_12]|uniref:Excinuclease ABC subunit C n=1 Tax=Candidatus Nomurabacteria bacterium RIFCSPLOWO2_01_FULL_41_12 TaxID=1801774 RepID=A0A1F6WUJ8_9BACT|nr:MAG: hypothetical protein A2732_02195 [Candidatus Nomurabacteria bacterium RIFCSPHIGHO2_01_FULL_40_10]OGI85539.1 MAG: hypothetical protein A3A05_02275 [Candidatus Nomurabacteria bacterium RIFCSPLOWO2_01_FULL_41_12]